jgi:type IV pilus assembly protein PilB
MAARQYVRLGELLINEGLITYEQLDSALVEQRKTKKRVGQVLVGMGLLLEENLIRSLSKQFSLEVLSANAFESISPQAVQLIPESLARNYSVMPVAIDGDGRGLTVATADPLNVVARDELHYATGLRIHFQLASRSTIQEAIERYYAQVSIDRGLEEMAQQQELPISISPYAAAEETVDLRELRQRADLPPVVKLINHLLNQAILDRASDIHIEPYEETTKVRLRVDGVLYDFTEVRRQLHLAVVSRVKILANMDIAEHRLPQDGGFNVTSGGVDYDFRVSTIPTIYGEKAVLRLLEREKITTHYTLESLGFEPEQIDVFKRAIQRPWGMILMTGPTGSGKTTTLHTALKMLRAPGTNIVTVEDPVEYRQPGIQQVQVKPAIGLDFARALRSILRQDPNIIMVGEIRDLETAQMAVRAALAGHLFFSTLHTNDAVSTIVRLVNFGIEPYLVAAALTLAASQRLVRQICLKCKEPYDTLPPERHLFAFLPTPPSTLYRGRGCAACRNTGYSGRIAVFDLLPITSEVRRMITQGADLDRLRRYAEDGGMDSLRTSGLKKVVEGITTIEEVLATCSEEA